MKVFQNEKVRRLLRPAIAAAGFVASVWHAMHAASAWTQFQQYKVSDPSLSEYFKAAMTSELTVSVVSMLAGAVAWRLFKPAAPPNAPPVSSPTG
jgi:hypothetical protein